jgi:hypothetical protein
VKVNMSVLPCSELPPSSNAAINMLREEYEYACELQIRITPSLNCCTRFNPYEQKGTISSACSINVTIDRRS